MLGHLPQQIDDLLTILHCTRPVFHSPKVSWDTLTSVNLPTHPTLLPLPVGSTECVSLTTGLAFDVDTSYMPSNAGCIATDAATLDVSRACTFRGVLIVESDTTVGGARRDNEATP